jgi:tRNA 2-thiouridine synthesizing protein A
VLLKKFHNLGFEAIEAHSRRPVGLADLRRYPLFTPEFFDFLQRVLPADRHDQVVCAIVVTARKPARREAPCACPGCGAAAAAGARFCSRCGTPLAWTGRLPAADAVLDLGDAGCEVGGTLQARRLMQGLAVGQVLEIRSTDPATADDVPAWCRLTGHEYLGADGPRYFVRKR